jgi:ABC transport system ATP-binding/permease protein
MAQSVYIAQLLMSILVSAHILKKSFAARPLFDGITFSIESGERIGLIGPNGAGKSTLLRILAQQAEPDQGTVSFQRGLRVGYLEQVPTFKPGQTVFETVMEGAADPDDWEAIARGHECISKLSLDDLEGGQEALVDKLSGGWKKRVALARELVREPDLLLLDEPTNHLDVESILWLEDLLAQSRFATLTITHDRVFLQKISNRILELDRKNVGGLLSINGDYVRYLETKDQLVSAQERREVILKNTLRRETEWLRRGAKARTTKQQARIQRHGELSSTVNDIEYRNRQQSVKIDFQSSERNPKRLLEAKGVSKAYGNKKIFNPIDILFAPGTRVGLLGPNGCGKSTLIRVLLGKEKPDAGEIRRADNLQVAYFEQNRETLDPKVSLAKTICPVGDYVDYQGGRIHIKSYLDRFLFTSGQFEMAVGKLSGGEQSRLLIAKLMLQPANLLVLDEPTNDLDMATLSVLEECLTEFKGSVILVTHDRYFLDQVANQIFAFDTVNKGKIEKFANLEQWETWHTENTREGKVAEPAPVSAPTAGPFGANAKKGKLSFKEQREWDTIESTIQTLEAEIEVLASESVKPELATNSIELGKIAKKMSELQEKVNNLYARWAELEAKVK